MDESIDVIQKSLSDRCIEKIEEKRERVLSGKINSIPLPFKRFRNVYPGAERSRYVLITANQKVGKSKLSDFLFMYEPFFYQLEHPSEFRLKVIYFTLEINKEDKMNEFYCHLLWRLDKIRLSTGELKSVNKDKPLDLKIIELLKSKRYQYYLSEFEKTVDFVDNIKHPTGINAYCKEYALSHGKYVYKNGKKKDEITGEWKDSKVIDYYSPDDPDEYRIIIQDNASNLTLEKGTEIAATINRMSKYNIELRDKFYFTPVLIQHQAQAQESLDNFKSGKLKPSPAGLADCKTTIRDINIAISIYSPFKHEIQQYEGYDITRFKNNIRFMEIMEDRDNGAGGMVCPLFFDGATSFFAELPLPTDKTNINKVYEMLDNIRDVKPKIAMINIENNKKYIKNGKNRRNTRSKWRRKINEYCNKSRWKL